MVNKIKIIRSATVPTSLNSFCNGMLKELSKEYEVVALSSPDADLDLVGKREGVRTIAVHMQRRIAPLSDLKSLWKLFWAFRRERPQMVHSMTPKAGLLCMMAAWAARVPVRLHTFTGLVFPTAVGLKKKILMATDWLTCACATHIIPEGEGVKNDLLNNGITTKPLKVLGYGNVRGIDLKKFDRTKDVMTEAEKIRKDGIFTFVFVGRIVGDKGINELVAAFSKLYDQREDVRLVLVGPYEDSLDPITAESRRIIETCAGIEAVGSQDDVRPWFAASDALVFPSYREGFPNVVIEAGAMGLPSIVTDINGSREIIKNGENGVIIPSKDATALYEAMRTMILNTQAYGVMAENARPMIESRFEQGFVRKCLFEYYDEILRLEGNY